jgi:glycosyltransferase involved in cell wall biosynthesis
MANSERRPVKVLNALWQLGVGGIESSLVDMLRHLDREQFQMDFLVTSQFESYYDSAVKEMGARIVLGKERFSPGRNFRELAAINRRFGPYDVLHSHRHYSGAPLLRAAHEVGIPVRIAHSHAIRTGEGSVFGRAGFAFARYLTSRHCTHGLAVSCAAAVSLFGPRWEHDQRFEVLSPGCNLEPFHETGYRDQVRRELDIGDGEIVLAHVGSFTDTKNHEFIVAVAKAINMISPDFRFVLIGDGPLLHRTRYLVESAGLSDRVLFLGNQPNVPLLLLAMDAFIFPSKVEAFGIAAVEAQAAGLVCFLSDRVVPEVDAVPDLLRRIPLEVGPEAWAREIVANCEAPISQASALDQCLASGLGSDSYIETHKRIYASALEQEQVHEN